jgi:hypothetical protein
MLRSRAIDDVTAERSNKSRGAFITGNFFPH